MAQSPGHKKWPDHKVEEHQLDQRVQVEVAGEMIADSAKVIELEEDRHSKRYYFPRSDVDMDKLAGSNTTSHCPFKGEAQYYSANAGVKQIQDVAWSYEDPYDEHSILESYIAFHDERPEVTITQTRL